MTIQETVSVPGEPSARISELVAHIFPSVPEIEADRACLITESYRKTEGLPAITRRARAFEHLMANMPIVIRPGELIVGNLARSPRGVQVFPEYSCQWIEKELDRFDKRPSDPYNISEKTKERLRDVFAYWKGKTNSDLADAKLTAHPSLFPAMEADVFTVANYRYAGVGHVSVDYGLVLQRGLKGVIDDALENILRLRPGGADSVMKKAFWEAVIISARGVIGYAHRFADLAQSQASVEADPRRRAELERVAANCRNVPEKPAVNFHEALQSFWFVHMILQCESNGHSFSPGRFDQYMFPFYDRTGCDGVPEERRRELLDSLWVKFNEVCKIRDEGFAKGFGGYPMFQNLNVGGQTEDGRDAANALSYACLDTGIRMKLPQPSLSIRVWPGSPEALLRKGAELARAGIGMPAWFNDDIVMAGLLDRGVSPKDARNYCILGCVEPNVGGKTLGMHGGAFFSLVKVLEAAFADGICNGVQVGPRTGDPCSFTSFDEFMTAYKRQLVYFVDQVTIAVNEIDRTHAERTPLPYQSSLIGDCMARGKSAQEGGARYNMTAIQGVGVANVADALMAVKYLVFDKKLCSMDKLLALLESNYGAGFADDTFDSFTAEMKSGQRILSPRAAAVTPQEGEYFQQLIANSIPKYGNDIEEVDALARVVAESYCREVASHRNARDGIFIAGLYPVSANVPMGKVCGATPDGRHAGDPLAEGVSPAAGRDVNGPTAALNSVARLNHSLAGNGALLNQKFHPSALEGDRGLGNLSALVQSYFTTGGSHVQFNVVDRATLLDAKEHPEQYANLVVRVAGYSAHFVNLNPAIQDDVIARTEQTLG